MRPRLFLDVASMEARTRMSYRIDFWATTVLGFLTEFALLWFIWRAMFAESGAARIGGFDFDGIVLYYGCVLLLAKLVRGQEFQGAISGDIYEGGLNKYLLFPASYLTFKYAQQLGSLLPFALQLAFFAALFPLVLDVPADVHVSVPSVLMGASAVLVANLLYFLMSVPIQAVAFWADNVWSLAVAQRFVTSLLGGAMLPLTLFPEWAQPLLRLLPYRYLFDFPANAALGRLDATAWAEGTALSLVWCGVFAWVARLVWRRGDLRYTGIGI